MALIPSIRGLPAAFWYVWAGTLINRAGGFVLPFLAIYLTDKRQLTLEHAGFILSLYGMGQLAGGMIGGFLADRIGRKRTLVLGLSLGAASMVALSFAVDPLAIAVATLSLGCLGDIYRPAVLAAVTDLVGPDDRARAFGLIYWAINLGFAIAPMLASLVAGEHAELLFWGDAITSLAFAAIIALRVPETLAAPKDRRPIGLHEALTPYRDMVFVGFAVATFVVSAVFQQAHSTLPNDMRGHGIAPETFLRLISLNGVAIVVLQPFSLELVKRFRPTRVLAVSALLIGLGFGVPALSTSVTAFAISIVIWTLGEIAMAPVAPTIVAMLAPKHLRGSYQGMHHVAWGASSAVAPVIGSVVLQRFGSTVLWSSCIVVSLISAAGFLALRRATEERERASQTP